MLCFITRVQLRDEVFLQYNQCVWLSWHLSTQRISIDNFSSVELFVCKIGRQIAVSYTKAKKWQFPILPIFCSQQKFHASTNGDMIVETKRFSDLNNNVVSSANVSSIWWWTWWWCSSWWMRYFHVRNNHSHIWLCSTRHRIQRTLAYLQKHIHIKLNLKWQKCGSTSDTLHTLQQI